MSAAEQAEHLGETEDEQGVSSAGDSETMMSSSADVADLAGELDDGEEAFELEPHEIPPEPVLDEHDGPRPYEQLPLEPREEVDEAAQWLSRFFDRAEALVERLEVVWRHVTDPQDGPAVRFVRRLVDRAARLAEQAYEMHQARGQFGVGGDAAERLLRRAKHRLLELESMLGLRDYDEQRSDDTEQRSDDTELSGDDAELSGEASRLGGAQSEDAAAGEASDDELEASSAGVVMAPHTVVGLEVGEAFYAAEAQAQAQVARAASARMAQSADAPLLETSSADAVDDALTAAADGHAARDVEVDDVDEVDSVRSVAREADDADGQVAQRRTWTGLKSPLIRPSLATADELERLAKLVARCEPLGLGVPSFVRALLTFGPKASSIDVRSAILDLAERVRRYEVASATISMSLSEASASVPPDSGKYNSLLVATHALAFMRDLSLPYLQSRVELLSQLDLVNRFAMALIPDEEPLQLSKKAKKGRLVGRGTRKPAKRSTKKRAS